MERVANRHLSERQAGRRHIQGFKVARKMNQQNPTMMMEEYTYASMEPLPRRRSFPNGVVHNFYIYGEIGQTQEYVDMFTILDTASENDVVNIYINSYGGDLFTAISIIHAMMRTQAQVVTHADGYVASAATLVFLSGTQLQVYPYTVFMFHDGSSGLDGKINESIKMLHSVQGLIKRMAEDIYYPFLTREEIGDIFDGRDLYIDYDECVIRLERVVESMKEQLADMQSDEDEEPSVLHESRTED